MKYFSISLIALVLLSCGSAKYKINHNGVRSNVGLTKLTLAKIDNVGAYDQKGVPMKFDLGPEYMLAHTGQKTMKKISFFTLNDNYTWFNGVDSVKTLPHKFSGAGWYVVMGLASYDRARHDIIFHVNERGKVKQYSRNYYGTAQWQANR